MIANMDSTLDLQLASNKAIKSASYSQFQATARSNTCIVFTIKFLAKLQSVFPMMYPVAEEIEIMDF
ncbi:MAG: hypothetical protein A2Z71_06145 [Chloroflexi bacterium RBG_13_50_21]|nr:MAG: hypothetical protein A2Z71_06145 [Chloroflexi bacterium RBG_13_50_21]